mgnify:FL=1
MDDEQRHEPIHCKIILVGDSGVGKTSIMGRYLCDYDPNEKATIGASFKSKLEKVEGKDNIQFEIWDTAGQERYRSVNSIFYQDAYICLLVYDITKKESFENLKNYWYNAVKECGSEGIIFHIAGNKVDLLEKEEVSKKEVEEYCQSIDAQFNYVSAFKNVYIDSLFHILANRFIESDLYKEIKKSKNEEKKNLVKLDDSKVDTKEEKNKKKCC